MKNADMPAMPMGKSARGSYWTAGDLWDGYDEQCKPAFGLTKREMFAMAAMQGLCAHSGDYHEFSHLASDAVNYADSVLAELEKTSCQ